MQSNLARDLRSFLGVFLAASLVACGSGGGDGPPIVPLPQPIPTVTGNGFAPETGPGDTNEYFPNATGNRWTLDYTTTESFSQPITGRLTVSVTGTKNVLGKNATVVDQVDSADGIGSGENYYYLSAGGITYVGNNGGTDIITAQIVPYVRFLFPVAIGSVSSVTATNLSGVGVDVDGSALLLDMTQQVVNTGFEDVNVTAGAFVGALKQTTTITGVVRSQSSSLTVAISGTETRWFVPHVGIVKETTSTTVDTETFTSNAELRGYLVNGVPRGLGTEFTVVDGLSPADGNPSPPQGRPVIATDGTSFMVVARRASGSSASYTTDWLAARVELDGTVGAPTPISSPTPVASVLSAERSAIAFDGTNYLVVYERDNNFAFTGNHPSLVAQRVLPDGTLVGSASDVASPGTNSPALAFDGTNYLLVYSRSNSYGDFGQLMGVFISPATGQTVGAEFPITAAQGYQLSPAIAFGGTNYLVVWDQWAWAAQTPGLYAARVTSAGAVLDAGGFAVFTPAANGLSHQPAVVFDGTNHVVTWLSFQPDNLHSNLHAMRVSTSGQLLDGTALSGGFEVTTGTNNVLALPTLTMFNGNILAAWNGDCSLGCGVYGARLVTPASPITPISVIGTPGFRFTAGGPYSRLSSVSTGALLIWLDRSGPNSPSKVSAMAIYPFGP
jgi:hypothetical protein